jgi:hypothetical protein
MATFTKKVQKNPNWLPQWENSPHKNTLLATIYNNRILIIFLQFLENIIQTMCKTRQDIVLMVIKGYVVFSGLMILFPKSKMDR